MAHVLFLSMACLAAAITKTGSKRTFNFGNSTSSEASYHIGFSNSSDVLLQDPGITISCENCTVAGDFSFSGGCGSDLGCSTNPGGNFSGLPFDYTDVWVGAVVEDFSAVFNLSFALNATSPNQEIDINLLSPLFPDGVAITWNGIDWKFNPTIHGWINSTHPVKFTYGFAFTIPKDSAIWYPLVHPDNVTSIGFGNSTLTPLEYTSTDPNDDFAFELSFRPIFTAEGNWHHIDIGSGELFADVPKLDIAVSQVMNVTSNCQPAANTTPSDMIFHNLTHVVPTLGFDLGWNVSALDGMYTDSETNALGGNITLPTACLYYQAKATELGAVPEKSTTNVGVTLRLDNFPLTYLAILAVMCLSYL